MNSFTAPFNTVTRFLSVYLIVIFIFILAAPFTWNFNKLMPVANFIPRYWEIDENFLFIYYEDGSSSKFRFEHLIQAVKTKEYYLLYLTAAGQFHYIPVTAFESEKDINRFELLLQGKQLLKLWK
ncbi:MAG TPA: YcxB family protein [Nostocaceae cyanobacterium]|nr:YcxB family protein [Nostocaceae cyanobacterium]